MSKIINYFGVDGLLHILVSAALTAVLALFLPLWLAAAITFTIGTAKEVVWDYYFGKGCAEYKDLLADIIGIGLGLIGLI